LDGIDYSSQIEHFKATLQGLAESIPFDLYCEEINHTAFSHAERCAIERKKRYVNIDLPVDIRHRLGIPNDYAHADKVNGDEVKHWHALREEYMFNRIVERCSPETVALVLCGHYHVEPLTRRFQEFEVQTIESKSVLDEPWFDAQLYTDEREAMLSWLRP
jgi:hypothetical protein